jgi:DNA-binding SARP family transcriptional activator
MRLRVLGTLELLAGGPAGSFTTVVPLRSPKLRRLLAALAVHSGSVVSADRLADVLWGDQPPANADGALHNLVSRLRAVLGGDDGLAVVTRAPGYALQPAATAVDSAVDSTEFTLLVAQARPRLGGEPDRAAALLDAALALWRGPAYAEFADEEFARAEVNRLEELRVTAAEYRVDAALALGLPDEAVVRLEPLVRGHPLRERPHVQLVTALYRCGRHADALQVYRDFRQRLDEELGLQPSAMFRRLEADVLRQDPGLTPPGPVPVRSVAAPAASAGASLPPPQPAAFAPVMRTVRGLPADPPPLVGRNEAVSRLRSVLHGARVVTLTGPGGVGKTSIAALRCPRSTGRSVAAAEPG